MCASVVVAQGLISCGLRATKRCRLPVTKKLSLENKIYNMRNIVNNIIITFYDDVTTQTVIIS